MKADDLWFSILQYAIQGKLVPQDLNDESASVLLERIREEKQRLVRERMIKKDKKESRIYCRDGKWFESDGKVESDIEVPFEIPNSWSWGLLFDVSTVSYGYPFDSSFFNNVKGMPLIRIRDLLPGFTKTYTTEEATSITFLK